MKIQYRAVDVSGTEASPHPAEKYFDFVATVAGAIAAVMLILTDVTTRYERGEIVVISRADDDPLVKRVVAVAGDTIDFRDGSVYLNGILLDEPYIDQETYDVSPGPPDFPLTVPRGYVFVMGDNRGNSLDSRSYEVGLVATHRILGKLLVHLSNSEE